ncbi:MAG: 30S ribosomal protein S15 [Rickettsiales bacterium]
MSITQEEKSKIIKDYGLTESDTGSPEVQCAILTHRILSLTEHMKEHHKDYHTRRGLVIMVSRRRHLLAYLKKVDAERYNNLISRLKLRK